MSNNYHTFFVLNGFTNGEDGERAVLSGGGKEELIADGWYYLFDGESDPQSGPFLSRKAAKAHADLAKLNRNQASISIADGETLEIAIEPGSTDWFVMSSDGYEEIYDANACEVVRSDSISPRGHSTERYIITIYCYYYERGELSMTITQPLHRAITTFARLLEADSELG